VGEGPVVEVGEGLLDDGVVTVLFLGLDQPGPGVGEHGVVAPDGEQLALPGGCFLVQVTDPADDQPGGGGLVLADLERDVAGLGDLRRYWQACVFQ